MTIIFGLVAISRRDLNVLENDLVANPSISPDITCFWRIQVLKGRQNLSSKLCAPLSLFPVFFCSLPIWNSVVFVFYRRFFVLVNVQRINSLCRCFEHLITPMLSKLHQRRLNLLLMNFCNLSICFLYSKRLHRCVLVFQETSFR